MGKLKLTIAFGDYEITRALKEGTVTIDGIEPVILSKMGSQEFIARMMRAKEFDVSEVGFNYSILATQPGPMEDFTAIPVFPHRRFRLGFVFVNPASGVKSPKDLIGQRVGSVYLPAGNVWARGILQEHYGVPYKDVKWVGERMGLYQKTPSWHEMSGPGVKLQDLLAEQNVKAFICPDLPPLLVKKDPRIGQLFTNYWDEDRKYYEKTGIFPIMHVIVLKREIVEKYPWVPTNLIKAFDESRRVAMKRLVNPRIVPLAFYRPMWEEQERLMGNDPWVYGLGDANRKNIQTFVRYMHEQEMIPREVPVDDIFAKFDMDDITPEDWN